MKSLALLFLAAISAASLSAADARTAAVPAGHEVISLWPKSAPGAAARPATPEKIAGGSVSGIHQPSLIVFPAPKDKANGCAVIVCPGGGHRNLVIVKEGYEIAEWLNARGYAAFVLKNRLANDDANPAGAPQPYTVERDALGDAQRAIRIVRSRATEWGVDPARIGIIGFSAGGEVSLLAGTRFAALANPPTDAIDRVSPRPDFFGLIYPGGLDRNTVTLTKDTPPVFLACGYGDRATIAEGLADFYLKCKRAGVVAELHIYSGAGHGFGIRTASNAAAATWIARFDEWLADRKFVAAAKPASP